MILRILRLGQLWLVVAFAVGLVTASTPSNSAEQQTQTVAGEWHGVTDMSVGEIALTVMLQQSSDGQWTGTIDIPEKDLANAPLRDIVTEGKGISFSIETQGETTAFAGTLDNAASTINGHVKIGRRTSPFKLERIELQTASARAAVPIITLADVTGLPSDRSSLALIDHPSILYSTAQPTDAIADLNRKIQEGSIQLKFESTGGYLRSVLDALKISVDTQMVVFSKTSVQAPRISPTNPRALFFRDDVTVGFIRGAPFLEFAAVDAQLGVNFYILDQRDTAQPRLVRRDGCLNCHVSRNSMDIPGLLVRSVVTGADGKTFDQFGSFHIDDRSPWEQRWGGWYVTGAMGSIRHMGNAMLMDKNKPEQLIGVKSPAVTSLANRFDTAAYPSPYSDIAALLVFEHQAHMTNLLIRMGWDARAALYSEQNAGTSNIITQRLLENDARETVDYLLFVDEVPLPGQFQPSSTFAATFSAEGPYDSRGRTLRKLSLQRRLMRYPCSYMIYSAAFDALPVQAKQAIYKRMWMILSGKEKDMRYRRVSAIDRRAVIEILRDTKNDLPDYFK